MHFLMGVYIVLIWSAMGFLYMGLFDDSYAESSDVGYAIRLLMSGPFVWFCVLYHAWRSWLERDDSVTPRLNVERVHCRRRNDGNG